MFWHVSFRFDILGNGWLFFGLSWYACGIIEVSTVHVLACLAMFRHVFAYFVPLWYPWEWFNVCFGMFGHISFRFGILGNGLMFALVCLGIFRSALVFLAMV